jgi:hypothetical protein
MANIAARNQARRFWGAMGAVMRHTSRSLDTRRNPRADTAIRRAHGFVTVKVDARTWRGS